MNDEQRKLPSDPAQALSELPSEPMSAPLPPEPIKPNPPVRYGPGRTRRSAIVETWQAQLDLERLRTECLHRRATNRCPGECVLSRARQERLLRQMETLDVLGNSTTHEEYRPE
jgi:hypothetical protein